MDIGDGVHRADLPGAVVVDERFLEALGKLVDGIVGHALYIYCTDLLGAPDALEGG